MPFFIFLIAITAELNRPPFDLVEADSELVGGFNTEYSSIRFALFYLAEFMNTITMSAIIVTLFFGGPDGPGSHGSSRPRTSGCRSCGSSAKMFVFLFIYVWLRAALPRLRYDQLMDLGWKVLIPVVAGLAARRRRRDRVGLVAGLLGRRLCRGGRRSGPCVSQPGPRRSGGGAGRPTGGRGRPADRGER